MIDLPPPSTVPIIEAVVQCGLQRSGVALRYEDILQSDVLSIAASAGASDTMFECIRLATWARAMVEFEQPELKDRYQAYENAKVGGLMKAYAQEKLRKTGKLDTMPAYSPERPLSEYLNALEVFCGLKPGSAFEVIGENSFTYKSDFLTFPIKPGAECLTDAWMASDMEQHGISLVFIGNAAVEERKAD
ncbi:hypothetical protein [Sphingobium abikonense]|uniref:hypothetical protein n=1 Tax=Sphingobium abikonense TaxID=86193 RepID=UPI0012ED4184|nr:hypothetical protein [Sphingobium abikonense]